MMILMLKVSIRTHNIYRNPATEVRQYDQSHLASRGYFWARWGAGRLRGGFDMSVHISIGKEDKEESWQVEAVEYGHRVLPSGRSLIGDVDRHAHTRPETEGTGTD